MINKRGQKRGPRRGDRQRFPYEPRVVGGKLITSAELQVIHRYVVKRQSSKKSLRNKVAPEFFLRGLLVVVRQIAEE